MSWSLAGRPLRRVLVTRLRYLGDVVMATVVADLLRRGDPGLEVGFLCEAAYAPVLAGHPAVDRVHRLGVARRGADAAARTGAGAADGAARGTVKMVRALRASGYDLAVDLLCNPRSAWLLRLAGIPLRIGGTAGSRRHLYTHIQPSARVEDPRHVLERWAPGGLGDHVCRLAPLVHAPSGHGFLDWLEADGDGPVLPRLAAPLPSPSAAAALAAVGVPAGGPYIVAAPAATWPAKEWPSEHWRRLLAAAADRTGLPLVTLVPPGPGRRWAALPGALPPLPLPAVLALLHGARAVVSVDGGVMHAAVALGRPVLALFGPTDPAIWFPYERGTANRVLATRPACHPCDRHACPAHEFICLPQLTPAAVEAALVALLDRTAAGTGGAA
ncbi:MAG: glycosyltransferase family 9 protein [Candidatus Krumholzibacteriia bacterium]